MKKVLSLVLILVLCMAMSAMAADSSDKGVTVLAGVAGLNIAKDTSATAQTELAAIEAKLAAEGTEAIFGANNAATISAVSTGKLIALDAMTAAGYDATMGDVVMTLSCAAAEALASGTKVAVAVGTPNGVENGATTYEWVVFQGIANGNGGVETTIDAATMAKVAEAGCIIAIYA